MQESVEVLWNFHANLLSVQGTERGAASAAIVSVPSTSTHCGDHGPPAAGVRAQHSYTNR